MRELVHSGVPILTIVFTDVVRSSEIKRDQSFGRDSAERDRAYLAAVQVPHYDLIRECYKEHGGQEVNTMGDAFYLIFPDPVEAVRCSISIQDQLLREPISTPRGPLRLRIGIHTGAPQPFDDDWHGTDVDTAARVEAMATGGQILVSPTTYELVRHMTDIGFHRMGEFMLKGIDRVILWEADWDGNGPRPTERSPVSLDLDLPPSLRGFVGRSIELAELESLLEKHSAVNVEGLSGIGKTSLALSLADRWLGSGRITPNGLFYFDCSQRNMRLGVASEFLLRNLAAFFSQVGAGEVASIVSNEEQPLDRRYNAISSALTRGSFLLFLDNLQDTLDENRRITSRLLADLLYFVLSRPLADSRFICASYVQCSWSGRLAIQPFRLKPLSTKDARALLLSLGIEDLELADRAAQLVGRHPQAIRWFSVLPRELGLSVEEVINDLSDEIDYDATGVEFDRRIEDELLKRIWDTLPNEVGHFLSVCTVFRRPVPFSALCALTSSPEVDRWRQILLDRFLLDASTREGPHSLHDIVRKFVAQRIQSGSDEWQDAHRAAANWWQAKATAAVHRTREELEAHIEAHYHLVSSGDAHEAHALAMRLRPILRTEGRRSYRQGLRQENEAVHRAVVQMTPNDPRGHLYLANTLSRLGKNYRSEAEFHFRKALELDPKFNLARHRYAQFLAVRLRNEEAEEQLRESIKNDPQDGRNHVRYASFLARNNRLDDAEAQFRVGLDLDPETAALRNAYALFLAQRDLHGEAENQFELALRTQPRNALVLESYARFLIDRNRFDEAERHLSQAIDIDPNSIHLLKAYFKLPLRNQRTEEAKAHLASLTDIGSSTPSLRREYLELFAKVAPPDQVDTEFKAALNVEPDREHTRNLYIKYLTSNGRIDEAEQQFKARINVALKKAWVHNSYAAFLSKCGRSKEAEEQFDAAIAAEPNNIGAYEPYIEFLSRRRRFDEADAHLRTMQELNPTSALTGHLASFVNRQKLVLLEPSNQEDTKELMAVLRDNMTNLGLPVGDRIMYCKAILENNPDDFQAHYCLGRNLMEQLKDAPSAEPFFRRATELQPSSTDARLYYGQALEKQGRFDEALVELSKIRSAGDKKNAELHNSRANCLKELGRFSEAEDEYRNALETSKASRTAKYLNNLALLFAAWPDTSRISEGLKLCDQVARKYPSFPWIRETRSKLDGRKK